MLITRQDIYDAAVTSFEKHSRDRQVIAFKKGLEGNVDRFITNQCGFIFAGSTNQMKYIEP